MKMLEMNTAQFASYRMESDRAKETEHAGRSPEAKISVRDLNFYYGKTQALQDISLEIPNREVMAFNGP